MRPRNAWGEKRQRVCAACVRPTDFVFGTVHSEAACQRCNDRPMGLGAVVGPSPFAEAT